MMMTGHMNATRFAQKPLPQPSYSFAHVPQAERDLRGSSLQYVEDRDDFHACMAEMLLMCKEAMRRRPSAKTTGSKPLSLEYLADRFDIDDPVFGYLVRTQENVTKSKHWQPGMLQGFITVTTFTNYQKSFRWDSLHEAAFSFDDEELSMERARGLRAWDSDGSLAAAMQSTVRCGDVWNEGIVWPRIAEISLLGGLGTGRSLVSLMIEHLECMKATGKHNYDYVVLQATDNSVSFYESMGFVRVGAIAKDDKVSRGSTTTASESDSDDEVVAEPLDESSPEKPNAVARTYEIVTSELTSYTTKVVGETPNDIAKQCKVDVWDIVFLNKDLYPNIGPTSRLLADTVLHVPAPTRPQKQWCSPRRNAAASVPQWYAAKENETCRMIARKFEISCLDLVEANKGRLEGLMSNSRLKEGTRIKISHLDVHEDAFKPYAHWSFPDDQFEEGEPSYMMARKLNRKRGAAAKERPYANSLATSITKYEPTKLVLPASPEPVAPAAARQLASPRSRRGHTRARHPGEPAPPKRPLSAYMLFVGEERDRRREELDNLSATEQAKLLGQLWQESSNRTRAMYEKRATSLREDYNAAKAIYEEDLKAFYAANPGLNAPRGLHEASTSTAKHSLYNNVVRLKPGAMTEGSEYTYWYVLTFIPDLKWCHLAPMVKSGKFGSDRPKCEGRPKWKLVDEKLGKEVDISSSFCIPIRSRAVRKTVDADKEEWDIIDDGTNPCEVRTPASRRNSSVRGEESDYAPSPLRTSTATKPSAKLKRKSTGGKRQSTDNGIPLLVLHFEGRDTYLRLSGHRLYDPSFDYPVRRKRGRPRGSLGKHKTPSSIKSKDEAEDYVEPVKRGPGRPKGSKNKPKLGEPPLKRHKVSSPSPAKRDGSVERRKFPQKTSPLVVPKTDGATKRKRGRPFGWRKSMSPDQEEVSRKRRKIFARGEAVAPPSGNIDLSTHTAMGRPRMRKRRTCKQCGRLPEECNGAKTLKGGSKNCMFKCKRCGLGPLFCTCPKESAPSMKKTQVGFSVARSPLRRTRASPSSVPETATGGSPPRRTASGLSPLPQRSASKLSPLRYVRSGFSPVSRLSETKRSPLRLTRSALSPAPQMATARRSPSTTSKLSPLRRNRTALSPARQPSSAGRPKRKTAFYSPLVETPRKRRKVSCAGSSRSVLQN